MRNDEAASILNGLIRLDFDAVAAYEAAVERLDDVTCRNRMQEFLQDHVRHTENLMSLVKRMGEEPSTGAGMMRALTEGAVVVGGMGGDKGVLQAMSTNEVITNREYENALEKLGANPEAAEIVRQNREDERRHKEWIDAALQADDFQSVDAMVRSQGRGQSQQRDLR